MPKQSNESKFAEFKARIDALEVSINDLKSQKVEKVVERILPETTEAVVPQSVINDFGPSDPVPFAYRSEIDRLLNLSFGIHTKGSGDAAAFQFTIVVPEKYSLLTPEQKAMHVPDIRTKVIEYALGTNGVKEWAEMVYKNFNNEMQALINADRVTTM